METQSVAVFEKKGRLFYQLILSTLTKIIAVSSLYIYAKVITKNEIGEIAYIQAIVVFLVTILSLQLPAAIFRHSLEKKYQNISVWVAQNSNYFFYISQVATVQMITPIEVVESTIVCRVGLR